MVVWSQRTIILLAVMLTVGLVYVDLHLPTRLTTWLLRFQPSTLAMLLALQFGLAFCALEFIGPCLFERPPSRIKHATIKRLPAQRAEDFVPKRVKRMMRSIELARKRKLRREAAEKAAAAAAAAEAAAEARSSSCSRTLSLSSADTPSVQEPMMHIIPTQGALLARRIESAGPYEWHFLVETRAADDRSPLMAERGILPHPLDPEWAQFRRQTSPLPDRTQMLEQQVAALTQALDGLCKTTTALVALQHDDDSLEALPGGTLPTAQQLPPPVPSTRDHLRAMAVGELGRTREMLGQLDTRTPAEAPLSWSPVSPRRILQYEA